MHILILTIITLVVVLGALAAYAVRRIQKMDRQRLDREHNLLVLLTLFSDREWYVTEEEVVDQESNLDDTVTVFGVQSPSRKAEGSGPLLSAAVNRLLCSQSVKPGDSVVFWGRTRPGNLDDLALCLHCRVTQPTSVAT